MFHGSFIAPQLLFGKQRPLYLPNPARFQPPSKNSALFHLAMTSWLRSHILAGTHQTLAFGQDMHRSYVRQATNVIWHSWDEKQQLPDPKP